jgi:hypothetical protein
MLSGVTRARAPRQVRIIGAALNQEDIAALCYCTPALQPSTCPSDFIYDAGKTADGINCLTGAAGAIEVALDAGHSYPDPPLAGCPDNPGTSQVSRLIIAVRCSGSSRGAGLRRGRPTTAVPPTPRTPTPAGSKQRLPTTRTILATPSPATRAASMPGQPLHPPAPKLIV